MRKRTIIYVLLLLLVIVCEYVLIIWTQRYGDDRAVVSHVEFAGTIVSMVLAVIAIIYSYFQTFLQQRDSQSLATQLTSLRELAGTLRQQGTQFGSLTRQIEDALAATGRTEQAVLRVRESVEELKARSVVAAAAAVQQAPAPPQEAPGQAGTAADANVLARDLAAKASNTQLAVYVGICIAAETQMLARPFAKTIAAIVADRLTQQGDADIAKSLGNWQDGIATGYLDILQDLQMAGRQRREDGEFVIYATEPFQHAVRARRQTSPAEFPGDMIDVASVERQFQRQLGPLDAA